MLRCVPSLPRLLPAALLALLALLCAPPSAGLSLDFATVGAPGNEPDDQIARCCFTLDGTGNRGAVDHVFRLSRYEITNAQYAEFLNAVAASDPNGLWGGGMATDGDRYGVPAGLQRQGEAGSYSYHVEAGKEQEPVRYINFFRAARFVNWLENGQPVGPQGPETTEDGAYTLLGTNPIGVTRNPGSEFFLPSQDEWYKAAYYDPVAEDYYDFPLRTTWDDPPTPGPPPGDGMTGNFLSEPRNCPDDPEGPCALTPVGAYMEATSPFGHFDMMGNVFELTESFEVPEEPEQIVIFGTGYFTSLNDASTEFVNDSPADCSGCFGVGFRVAAVPEPGSSLLLAGGLVALAALRRGRRG